MSTKIYNGFKLSDGMDEFDFFEKVRPQICTLGTQKIFDHMAASALDKADRSALCFILEEDNDSLSSPMADTILELCENYKNARSKGNLPLGCVRINFTKFENSIYGIWQGDEDFAEVFNNAEGFNDYSYWNNTDKPDSVSDEEWDERKRVWWGALPGVGSIRENMISCEIFPEEPTPLFISADNKKEISRIAANIETKKRVSSLIVNLMAKTITTDEFISKIMRIHRIVLSDIKEVEEIRDSMIALLPEVTENYLYQNFLNIPHVDQKNLQELYSSSSILKTLVADENLDF